MKKKQEYYGILLNDDIPKIDKVNKYNKEVELRFEGEAYLIEYDDENKPQRVKKFESGDELKYEKDYEIEFINSKNEIYNLQVRIETSYLFFILLLFWLGFLIGLILTRPIKNEESILERFYNFINLSIIELNIERNEPNKPSEQYDFEVAFKNIDSDDINFTDTINGKALAKNKIAPRNSGEFFDIVKYTKKHCRYEV